MFTVDIDLSGFQRAAAKTIETLQFGVRDAVRGAAQEGADEAVEVGRFRNRTGRLRRGIVARFLQSSENAAKWEIVSLSPYSRFVENGTRPHVIYPVNALALRFVINGQVIFARKVNHPGTRPMPFMGPAYLKAERSLYRHFDEVALKVQRLWE